MAFQRVPLTYEIRLKWANGAVGIMENLLHQTWSAHVTLTQVIADALAEAIEGAFDGSGVAAFLSNQTVLTDIMVTDLDAEGAPQFSGAFDAFVGDSAAEYLPLQSAAMIEWLTAFRGRSGRGKTFLGGFTEVASDGRPVAGLLAALESLALGLVTAMTVAGPPSALPSIVSRFSGGHLVDGIHGSRVWRPMPRPEAETHTITAHTIETVWKTQRRRAVAG